MKQRGLGVSFIGLALAACSSSSTKDNNEPSTADIYVSKGVQYMENGRLDIALQDLNRAVELDDNNAEAHNALGVLRDRLNQPDEAEEEFKRALSLDKKNASVSNNYGRLLCAQGQFDRAMNYFRVAMEDKLYKSPWLALTNAGLCARHSGKGPEGEALLRKALDANPDFAPALLEMARLSLENGNYLSARGFLQRLESAGEPTPESLSMSIQTEQSLGNYREADAYRKQLLRLFPDSKEAKQFRRNHSAN